MKAVPQPLRIERRSSTIWLIIDRQERRNALNAEVARGIERGLDEAEADRSIRAIVLTGAGEKAFCAGGDLVLDAEGSPFAVDPADPRHYAARLLMRMDACRLPIIARVNGHALAGGFGLVCACDLVVAREDALLGVTEVKVGVFPMMILPYLQRVLSYRRLMEFCLTGEPIRAGDAAAADFVNHAVPAGELDERLAWLLSRIVDKSPTGIRLGKQALRRMWDMPIEGALEHAQLMLANMVRTKDAREGMQAFNDKRPPVWTAE